MPAFSWSSVQTACRWKVVIGGAGSPFSPTPHFLSGLLGEPAQTLLARQSEGVCGHECFSSFSRMRSPTHAMTFTHIELPQAL